jgi:predicted Zn-dependent peptidase
MQKLILLLLLLLSWAQFGVAQRAGKGGKSPQKKIEFVEYDLPNGLHVILHQDRTLPIVATYVLYHVGSKNERPDRTGFAHFFEHLMFEGTENIKRGQIDKLVSGAGGNLNASTSFDRTDYYLILPSNQLKLALWIESERMLHAKIDFYRCRDPAASGQRRASVALRESTIWHSVLQHGGISV